MTREALTVGQTGCTVYRGTAVNCILIQPVDEHDQEGLDREARTISDQVGEVFLLAAFRVRRWNEDLSPWPAPPVFGREAFGEGAEATLAFIRGALLPALYSRYGVGPDTPAILGGYSLAGFFALWAAYRTDAFAAAAAASPSVWFPGWMDCAASRRPLAGAVYLSLGDREEKTRNPVMATVGACIRRQDALLGEQSVRHVLEWNEGNHFRDPDLRCAKAFAWCVRAVAKGAGA